MDFDGDARSSDLYMNAVLESRYILKQRKFDACNCSFRLGSSFFQKKPSFCQKKTKQNRTT